MRGWGKKERQLRFYDPDSSPGWTESLHCRPQPLSVQPATPSPRSTSLGQNRSQGLLARAVLFSARPPHPCCLSSSLLADTPLWRGQGGENHQPPPEPPLTATGMKQTLRFYTPSISFASQNPRKYVLCTHFTEESSGAKKAEMTRLGSYCQ